MSACGHNPRMPPKTRGQKAKAKAKPRRSYSSSTEGKDEDFVAEPLLSPGGSIANQSKKSVSSRGGNRRPLTTHSNCNSISDILQIELLEACEGELGGGLSAVKDRRGGITDLCRKLVEEGREDPVGAANSTQRKAVDSKFRNWFKLTPDKCEALLGFHSITPFKFSGETYREHPKKTSKKSSKAKPPKVISMGKCWDTDTSLITSNEESTHPSTKSLTMEKKKERYPLQVGWRLSCGCVAPVMAGVRLPLWSGSCHGRSPATFVALLFCLLLC